MVDFKFIIKTIADCLLAGLISIGVFQTIISLPSDSRIYDIVTGFFFLFLILMIIYSWKFREKKDLISLVIASIVSMVEIFFIGAALGKSFDMILLVWYITIPSIMVFDKNLG